MFIKLVAIIILGMTMSLGGPDAPAASQAEVTQPEALLSVCIGPMIIGFGASGDAPVNLSFNANTHNAGLAGLFGVHVHTDKNPLKTNLSGRESVQKLPNRLPRLP